MSDITNWLIAEADTCRNEDLPVSEAKFRDAAAEIKRLRAALRGLAIASQWYIGSMSVKAGESYDKALDKAREALGDDG